MLVIKEATYGNGPNYVNVTNHLQSLIKNDSIDVVVGPNTMGSDPSVGTAKSLSVTYVVDGVQEQKTIKDGSTFSVYTTPFQSPAIAPPRQVVGNATTSLFTIILGGLSTFLHILGVGIAYKVGTTIFDPIIGYILTAISMVIPYFGLWAVPLIVFFYRLISRSDLSGLAAAPAAAKEVSDAIVSA
jgi:hypothetical protein